MQPADEKNSSLSISFAAQCEAMDKLVLSTLLYAVKNGQASGLTGDLPIIIERQLHNAAEISIIKPYGSLRPRSGKP